MAIKRALVIASLALGLVHSAPSTVSPRDKRDHDFNIIFYRYNTGETHEIGEGTSIKENQGCVGWFVSPKHALWQRGRGQIERLCAVSVTSIS